MEKQFSYRITKIGGRAVSVAICALAGVAIMGSAQATEYFSGFITGTTYSDGGAAATAISPVANNSSRSETSLADSVIFRPAGVASTYTGVNGRRIQI